MLTVLLSTPKILLYISLLLSCERISLCAAPAQSNRITYELRYAGLNDPQVTLRITPEGPLPAPVTLVIPRTYPGGYSFVRYDDFLEDVHAFTPTSKSIDCKKDEDGPRWTLGQSGESVSRIEYVVNVGKMEDRIRDSVESSKIRKNYAGLLGYSVFGYIDGLEQSPVILHVSGPSDWPVLTTLDPLGEVPRGAAEAKAPNYDVLADSQIVMGPGLQFRKLDGRIRLVIAVYSEGEEDVDTEAKLARQALDRVQEYFGDTPFSTYTALVEILQPKEGHTYNFSQEHDTSGTFSLSIDNATTANSPARRQNSALFNYAHHMAHSWVPKRVWGIGYRPFNWELTPVIETIWFNEGFGRYASLQAIAAGMPEDQRKAMRQRWTTRMRGILDDAPAFIKRMPLPVLSEEASFLYAADFRTGMNVFARGVLMAAEIDDRIQTQTQGKKSLRDGFRALLAWSAQNQRAFQVEEMAAILTQSTGVDIHDIVERWMQPLIL